MSDPKTVQLNKLLAVLPGIIKSVEYSELYGYDLNTIEDIPDGLIIRDRLLDKFLVANKYNVDQAAFQLQNTLEWRKNFNPLSAGFRENHEEVFKQIGVITSVPLSVAAPPRPGTAAYAAAAIRAKNAGPSNTTATDGQESESSDEEDEEEDEAQEPVPEAEDAPIGEEAGVKSVVADDATESKADEEADHEAEPEASEAAETEHEVATEHEPETSSKSTEDSESAPKGNIIVTWNLYGRVRDRAKVLRISKLLFVTVLVSWSVVLLLWTLPKLVPLTWVRSTTIAMFLSYFSTLLLRKLPRPLLKFLPSTIPNSSTLSTLSMFHALCHGCFL